MPLLATAENSSAPPAYDTWKVGGLSQQSYSPLHAPQHSLHLFSHSRHASMHMGSSVIMRSTNTVKASHHTWDTDVGRQVNDA
jgi:hypothetical protein